ncbi:MAG TPA: TIGR01777 family oxidoreductase [bacterium]|nr:TIGR01777 family oxidoreductase [bacterium]HPR88031.1 TIGR01777 family oxidoreductase [bacterium]
MKIAITGASGLIGTGLVRHLEQNGHDIHPLVRRWPLHSARQIFWNPAKGEIDRDNLEGLDAVIHLAGENLGSRWNSARKERIMKSRCEGTRLLAAALARLRRPPAVFISASATGFYGNRGETLLDESAAAGSGFLAEVCAAWEAAAAPARAAGIPVVHPRFGIILDRDGGALARLLPLLRLGLGGKLGNGRQYWSWVAMADVHRALTFLLEHPVTSGPVNLTAPAPVTNAVFTRTLAHALHRPAFLAAPAFALRLVLGEMADEMLLSSARVVPARLTAAGFRFAYPDLATALPTVLVPTE